MIDDFEAAIDIEAILEPFAGEQAVGVDLRTNFSPNSLYFKLRDARAEARAAERSADGAQSADSATPPEWRTVRQLAIQSLSETTKDLEIAAWLTEALLRGEGVAGLSLGFKIMSGLVRRFWNSGLYPQEDEDGIAGRVAPITGLNGEGADGTLTQPLRKQIFFRRPSGDAVAFWEYEASRRLQREGDPQKRQQGMAAGVKPFDELERDAQAVGTAHFAAMRRRLRDASASWSSLSEALDTAAGRESPPTAGITEILKDMIEASGRYVLKEEDMGPPDAPTQDLPAGEAVTTVAAPAGVNANKTETREDMLRELARIADFFRRTEPHSPLAYTLDDAVRRGRMTWPDLLAEIVPDLGARSQMLLQLGIKPSP